MPPVSHRDFLRVADHRRTTAEFLFRHGYTLDAQYLGGYAVECSLKSLILHRTPEPDRAAMRKRITRSAAMHRAEVLFQVLAGLGIRQSLPITKRMRRYDWTTDLRYESGRRDKGETRAMLNTMAMVYAWVEEQLS